MRAVLFRLMLCLGAIAAAECAAPAVAQVQRFPYEATVSGDDVFVRSGPGKKYYPTAKLKAGERVVVHRHDPGGWYMIAPPPGSFSWIRSDALRAAGNRRTVVAGNNVPVYVGSGIGESQVSDVEQIRLSTNDDVQLLDEIPAAGPGGQKLYRIAPPRGEYRWVLGQFLVPADDSLRRQHDRDPFNTPSIAKPAAAPKDFAEAPARRGSAPEIDDAAAGFVTRGRVPALPSPPVTSETHSAASQPLTSPQAVSLPTASNSVGVAPNFGGPNGSSGLNAADAGAPATADAEMFRRERQRLMDLDASLRAQLESDIQNWNLDALDAEYRQLAQTAMNPTIARQIEPRLKTIAQNRQLKTEYDEFMRITSETSRRDAELASLQGGTPVTAQFQSAPMTTNVAAAPQPQSQPFASAQPTPPAAQAQPLGTFEMRSPLAAGPQFPSGNPELSARVGEPPSPIATQTLPGGAGTPTDPFEPPIVRSVDPSFAASTGTTVTAPQFTIQPLPSQPPSPMTEARGQAVPGVFNPNAFVAAQPGAQPAPRGFQTVPRAQVVPQAAPQFSGAGIVQRLRPAAPGMPQHVLVAPNGRVLAFLQQGPTVNLDQHVGRPIGVVGNRAHRPDLRGDLISVDDVSPVRLSTR